MKIKIKVKNLIKLSILALFIVLVVVPYATLEVAKFLDRKGSDKAIAFYESYLNKPLKLQNAEALYNYAVNLAGDTDKYTIMMRGWGGSVSAATLEDLQNAKKSLEKILIKDSKEDLYYSKAYSKMMDICISLQEPDELLNWIEWGRENANDEINYISDLYRAFYHYANRDFELANKALEGYDISNPVVDRRYYLIKGEIALFQGEYELAKRNFELANSFNTVYSENLFGSRSYIGREYWYREYEATLKGQYRIRGKVVYNGKPMPFVEVYVQDDTGIRTGGNDHVAITDINGEYETLGIRPGRYQIGIGLSNSLLYDKVYLMKNLEFIDLQGDMDFDYKFNSPIKIINPKPGTKISDNKFIVEWDNVSGTDYYTVELTTIKRNEKGIASTFRSPIIDENGEYRIRETKAVFDLEKLKGNFGGLAFDGEEMLLQPIGILGNIIPGEEHPIVVNAYDINGNKIGSSLPVNSFYENLSSIKLEGHLTEGEQLISESKYVEAINYYENLLKSEPNNKEALLYLAKIYMIGWKDGEQNIDKAIDYSIRYKDITNDYSMIFKTIGFMNHNETRENKNLIKNILNEIPEEEKNMDYYFELARFYTSIGEFKAAREAYKNTDSYIPDDVLYLDLYLRDFDSALNILSNSKFATTRMSKYAVEKAINNFKNEDIDVADYELFRDFLEKILTRSVERTKGMDLFNSTYNKISNSNLKDILSEIKIENYWDMDY